MEGWVVLIRRERTWFSIAKFTKGYFLYLRKVIDSLVEGIDEKGNFPLAIWPTEDMSSNFGWNSMLIIGLKRLVGRYDSLMVLFDECFDVSDERVGVAILDIFFYYLCFATHFFNENLNGW